MLFDLQTSRVTPEQAPMLAVLLLPSTRYYNFLPSCRATLGISRQHEDGIIVDTCPLVHTLTYTCIHSRMHTDFTVKLTSGAGCARQATAGLLLAQSC